MAENETLSMAVVKFMLERNFSLTRVAEVVGLQNSELTKVNRGEREFKANHLLMIARHLNLPLAALLAKAMEPYADPATAGDQLGTLLTSVANEVDVVLEKRKHASATKVSLRT